MFKTVTTLVNNQCTFRVKPNANNKHITFCSLDHFPSSDNQVRKIQSSSTLTKLLRSAQEQKLSFTFGRTLCLHHINTVNITCGSEDTDNN